MCGLTAVLGLVNRSTRARLVQRMTHALRHRGPDDQGFHEDDFASLGFRRLAILDLTPAGHQPMLTPDGDCAIVFNGEIYNYIELREELKGLGHVFRSTSDTEVLLRSYLQWGSDCVSRFNGMWAFIISDRKRRVVFGSRDRFGIKPLYRWSGGGYVLLASEIKALRATGIVDTKINRSTAAGFLLEGRLDESEATFFQGITQLGAGSNFEIDGELRYREWRYWHLDAVQEQEHADPASEFAELFEDAVRLHSRSDVPVGVHLSGGLDSTAIICAAARERDRRRAVGPLEAFSYHDPDYDETRYVTDTVRQTRASLFQLEPEPSSVWADLKAMLAFQDEPVHSLTPVIGFQLMRLSREHRIPVILNGQGADETLGGYPTYFQDLWMSLLRRDGRAAVRREITRYAAITGGSAERLMSDLLRYSLRSQLRRFTPYRQLSGTLSRRRNLRNDWIQREAVVDYASAWGADRIGLRRSLMHSVERDPLPIYLRVEDRNAMAHSIEARLPFLDYRLVSFAFSLAPEWKLRDATNKYVLRQAMRDRIPESVRTRPEKMGFPTPSARWFATDLHEPARQAVIDLCPDNDEFLKREALLSRLERHRAGESGHTEVLIRSVQFLLWRQIAHVS